MKFMSFNTQHCLNYLEQQVDYEIMAKAILDADADIIGLNEMFDGGENAKYGYQIKTQYIAIMIGKRVNMQAKKER